ncbi:MAG: hypothetical protein R3A45_11470 [Bdellovibrionota bacterium]
MDSNVVTRANTCGKRSQQEIIAQMNQHNPHMIPRNHWVQRAIDQSIQGDNTTMEALLKALRHPFDPTQEHKPYLSPPTAEETIAATFCGT